LYPPQDEIIERAVVDHDGHVLLHTLVRLVRNAGPDSEAIHGITPEE